MKILSAEAERNFEKRMVVHVQKCFPEYFEQLGEDKVREVIQYGVGRAAAYGVNTERDVCLYIDVIFTFGSDFDKDTELPWAREILEDASLADSRARMNALHDRAMQHLEKQAERMDNSRS